MQTTIKEILKLGDGDRVTNLTGENSAYVTRKSERYKVTFDGHTWDVEKKKFDAYLRTLLPA